MIIKHESQIFMKRRNTFSTVKYLTFSMISSLSGIQGILSNRRTITIMLTLIEFNLMKGFCWREQKHLTHTNRIFRKYSSLPHALKLLRRRSVWFIFTEFGWTCIRTLSLSTSCHTSMTWVTTGQLSLLHALSFFTMSKVVRTKSYMFFYLIIVHTPCIHI
jgi:hypothetical protein